MKCTACGVNVKDENLRRHYASVHPKLAIPESAAKPRRQRQPMTHGSKKIAGIILLTVTVIVALAVVLSVQHVGQGSYPFPCTTGAQVYHWHPTLTIRDANGPVTVPANTGISATCMEPLHTHDASGTIHVETDVNRLYTIGDFFKVWGKPFGSPSQMLVNGTAITATPDRTLYDQEAFALTYSGTFA